MPGRFLLSRPKAFARKQCILAAQPPIRQKLKDMLLDMDFCVSEADTGLAVLCQCAKRAPEVILLDLRLPVMSGIEVAHTLRRFFPLVRPRILMIAESAAVTSLVSAITAGADDYLLAPFERDLLAGKLAALGLA